MIARLATSLVLGLVTICTGSPASLAAETGLRLVLESRTGVAGEPARDARLARLLALQVARNESPTPFLPAGPFVAVFEGFIEVDFLDDYTFHLEGRGRARLEIAGELVLQGNGDLSKVKPRTVELEEGPRPIVLRYESTDDGSGDVRVEWSCIDFERGPVSPALLRYDGKHELLQRGISLRRGRELFARRRCLSCHASPSSGKFTMPELAGGVPSFMGIGGRLRAGWIADWILAPRGQRPEAVMPAVLVGTETEQTKNAADLAAFLARLGADRSAVRAPTRAGDSKKGEELFASIGCDACHRLGKPEAEPKAARQRVMLDHVAKKWKPAALARFLREPAAHWPTIRMPDLGLSVEEAGDLAAWLLSRTSSSASGSGSKRLEADAERGRELLQTSGCLGCHEPGDGSPESVGLENRRSAPELASLRESKLRSGCLATDSGARGGAPDFALEPGDLQALRLFLAHGVASLQQSVAVEYAERTISRLRCRGCHQRDGKVDLWTEIQAASYRKGDSASGRSSPGLPLELLGGGVLAHRRPLLTWTGEKLRPSWLVAFLANPRGLAARPWLDERMPLFRFDTKLLARGLADGHGMPPLSDKPVTPEPGRGDAAVGGKLVAIEGGFSCVNCHALAGEPAKAISAVEARAPDLATVPARLRKEFFFRWLLDPQSVRVGTKMPQFASQGVSVLDQYYGGDGVRQFDAIWKYLVEKSSDLPSTPRRDSLPKR